MPDHDPQHDLPWIEGLAADHLAPTVLREPMPDSREGEISVAYPFGWTPRGSDEVAESWRRQCVLIEVDGTPVRIQARLPVDGYAGVRGDQGDPDHAGGWPLAGDVLIAGSVRGPATYFVTEQLASRDELAHQATTFLVRARGAILVDRGHQWSEPAVIATARTPIEGNMDEDVDGTWQARFLGICHQLGIETVVRVRDGKWQVLILCAGNGSEVRLVSSDPCSITRDVEHRCPLLPSPEAGQYCRMRGGPWTSSSIHAAAAWKNHRRQIGAAVGCDTCEGTRYMFQGQVHEGGGPVSVVDTSVPTRWLTPGEARIAIGDESDA